ncbi:hypothetical protein [Pseudaestuariivita atlantica]|uniref:Uncharacterized protein n=1 Tax=Pseudaestuariivita atlantica TaxID=1317121 RepID=A0A0L1JNM2_9RHOB|nr:hypothetical protein [Pseudaestuariivita atlantica]KNG93370.1 hypothetical protein ATO11_13105 [Pseudaestuariivita atlantica]
MGPSFQILGTSHAGSWKDFVEGDDWPGEDYARFSFFSLSGKYFGDLTYDIETGRFGTFEEDPPAIVVEKLLENNESLNVPVDPDVPVVFLGVHDGREKALECLLFHRLHGGKEPGDDVALISEPFFRTVARDIVFATLSDHVKNFRDGQNTIVIPKPRRLTRHFHSKPKFAGLLDADEALAEANAIIDEIIKEWARGEGVELIMQPKETIDPNGMTKEEYRKEPTHKLNAAGELFEDTAHMNVEFAKLMIEELLAHTGSRGKDA